MERTLIVRLIGLSLLLTSLPLCGQTAIPGHDPKKIQVLILTGYNMHDWRTVTNSLRGILEASGRFEVRVNEEPQGCSAATFEGYDVIVLNYTNYLLRYGPAWTEATRTAASSFVASGKGLVAFHGAMSAFDEWPEYEKMTGGAWRAGSRHAPYHTFEAKIVDAESPVTRGLPRTFIQSDEISQAIRFQKDIRILVTAFDDPANCTGGQVRVCGSGRDETLVWTHQYGSGRVFSTLLGHDVKSVSSPAFVELFQRGVEWAARGSVAAATAAAARR